MAPTVAGWINEVLSGGRYCIVAKLGEGGMGIVYKGRDLRLDAEVVLKVPRRAMLDDPDFSERFQREVRALVKLSHPNVVRVTDLGEHDGLPYAVMQYLSGGSLDDRRPRTDQGVCRPLAPGQLGGWLEQVAAALDFVHAQGYVHRDVKPGNIIFDEHAHAYLSDFGVAKVVSESAQGTRAASLTGTGMVLGTPDYMSPELVMGQQIDGRSDQYALAVMVYELLAGRVPFTAATPAAVLVKQATEGAVALKLVAPTVPDVLSAAVMRGMEKSPERRYTTCQEFAQAVIACAAEGASSSPAAQIRKVTCPGCGKSLQVKAEMVGRKVRCPDCRATWGIGASTLAEPSAASFPALSATTGVLSPIVRRRESSATGAADTPAGFDTISISAHRSTRRRPEFSEQLRAIWRRRSTRYVAAAAMGAILIVVAGWFVTRPDEPKIGWAGPPDFDHDPDDLNPDLDPKPDPDPDPRPVDPTPPRFIADIHPEWVVNPAKQPPSFTEIADDVKFKTNIMFAMSPTEMTTVDPASRHALGMREFLNSGSAGRELIEPLSKLNNAANQLLALPADRDAQTTFQQALEHAKTTAEAIAARSATDDSEQPGSRATGKTAENEKNRAGLVVNYLTEIESAWEQVASKIGSTAGDQTSPPPAPPRDDRSAVATDVIEVESDFTNSLGMKFRRIAAGEFDMGQNDDDPNNRPVHRVQISRDFYLGMYEVTQAEYQAVTGTNPSHVKGESLPVVDVSAVAAERFCVILTGRERGAGLLADGAAYRLPTEAEWEYAARAGTTTTWSFGDDEGKLAEYAWYGTPARTSGGSTHRVGRKRPSAWGLFDMYGNVLEWCSDRYGPYNDLSVKDPAGAETGSDRIMRGGAFHNQSFRLRSAYRYWKNETYSAQAIGFRVALTAEDREDGTSASGQAAGGVTGTGQPKEGTSATHNREDEKNEWVEQVRWRTWRIDGGKLSVKAKFVRWEGDEKYHKEQQSLSEEADTKTKLLKNKPNRSDRLKPWIEYVRKLKTLDKFITVYLVKEDGTTLTVKKDSLSENDRNWIKEFDKLLDDVKRLKSWSVEMLQRRWKRATEKLE